MKLTVISRLVFLMVSASGSIQEPTNSTPAQQSASTIVHLESAASPEMDRLAKALAGDWDTVETMERSDFFPNGGGRHGIVHARLAAGGNTLIYEVHSNGSAGKLDGSHTIWWDKGQSCTIFLPVSTIPIALVGCAVVHTGREMRLLTTTKRWSMARSRSGEIPL
jgi:hypothetical protein